MANEEGAGGRSRASELPSLALARSHRKRKRTAPAILSCDQADRPPRLAITALQQLARWCEARRNIIQGADSCPPARTAECPPATTGTKKRQRRARPALAGSARPKPAQGSADFEQARQPGCGISQQDGGAA